jgi:hypothetical protein
MVIEWGFFLPALLMLFYPAERIFPASRRLRSYEQLTDPARSHRHWWWRWQPALWLDAVRIGLAVWLLNFSVTPVPGEPRSQVTAVLSGLLLLGLIPQMVTRRKDNAMFAPVGYVLATLCVMLPLTAVLPIAALGIVGLMALRDFTVIFLVGSISTVVLGYLLGAPLTTACMVAAVFALPVVVGAMFQCQLVLPVRSQGESLPTAPLR